MHPQKGYITSLALMTFYLLTRSLSQDTSRLTEVHFILRTVGTCCLVQPPCQKLELMNPILGFEATTCQQIQGNVCRNLTLPMIGGGNEVGQGFSNQFCPFPSHRSELSKGCWKRGFLQKRIHFQLNLEGQYQYLSIYHKHQGSGQMMNPEPKNPNENPNKNSTPNPNHQKTHLQWSKSIFLCLVNILLSFIVGAPN